MTYSEVLVGTDGSPTAGRAVAAAARLAAALDAPIVIATAYQREPEDPPARSEQAQYPGGGGAAGAQAHWATATTSDAAAIARQAGAPEVEQLQVPGRAADALLALAEQRPDALLVVGSYGLGDRVERLVGNVPHALTHHSPVDLLLTTAGEQAAWTSIALATDGSPTATRAVAAGAALAAAVGVVPTLCTVARDEPTGRAVLQRAREDVPGLESADAEVRTGGDIADGLAELAAAYDLLVIGNKGMSGPSRLLGSVANRVTHHVPTDLLLVNTTR